MKSVYKDIEFLSFEVKSPVAISKSDVSIDFNPSEFNRLVCNPTHESMIEKQWQEKCSQNDRLHNGSKFRLKELKIINDKEGKKTALLQVGITSYKDILGTHYGPLSSDLMRVGRQRSEDPYAFMSNGIGVGAWAVTKDDFILILHRANWTGEGAGKLDRPGGHPEPEIVKKRQNLHSGLDVKDFDYKSLEPEHVLDEIFLSPQQELCDEANIPLEKQLSCLLLGLIRNLGAGGRCGLDFLIPLDLSREEVEKLYSTRQQAEADESIDLQFLSKRDVVEWNISQALERQMTEHCVGGLKLLNLFWKNN